MTEQVVEIPECLWCRRLRGVFYPVERCVVIHRGHQRKSAGRTDQIIAEREQTKVFGRITLWEMNEEIIETLTIIVFIQIRIVATDIDLKPLLRITAVVIAADDLHILLVAIVETTTLKRLVVATTDMHP